MIKHGKLVIGIFGKRNNGKSTLVNCITGQDVSIVSNIAGTTTDPVKKSMEMPGLGAAILIDTPGIDDQGELGLKRHDKGRQVIEQVDLALLVITDNSADKWELSLLDSFRQLDLPFIVVHNKTDITPAIDATRIFYLNAGASSFIEHALGYSPDNILRHIKVALDGTLVTSPPLLGDLVEKNDLVLLITPIDNQAPAGRLILPQVQAIRDVLDNNAISIVLKESELAYFLKNSNLVPKIAVTDSQLFESANKLLPGNVMLTSFSILLARFKGDFEAYKRGTPALASLSNGARVLILESCTHHATCNDIGRVKLPRWIKNYTGQEVHHEIVAGLDPLPPNIENYSIVIQCGGCMITRRQLKNRIKPAIDAGVPVTNYGMAIAWMHGIYERAMEPFALKPR